jgi:hypothetical protein
MTGHILGPEDGSKALSHLIKADPQLGSNRLGMGKQELRASGALRYTSMKVRTRYYMSRAVEGSAS